MAGEVHAREGLEGRRSRAAPAQQAGDGLLQAAVLAEPVPLSQTPRRETATGRAAVVGRRGHQMSSAIVVSRREKSCQPATASNAVAASEMRIGSTDGW